MGISPSSYDRTATIFLCGNLRKKLGRRSCSWQGGYPGVIGPDRVAHPRNEKRTLAALTPKIVSGIDQRLGKLVRCGQADFVADAEPRPPGQHGFHEYEQDGPALEKVEGGDLFGVSTKHFLQVLAKVPDVRG